MRQKKIWGSEHRDSNGQLLLHQNTRALCVVDITPAGNVVLSAAPCQRHCLFAVLTCPRCHSITGKSREVLSGRWLPKTAEQTRCAELQWTRSSEMPTPEHYWRVISSYWPGKGKKPFLCWPSSEGWGWEFWEPEEINLTMSMII